MLPTNSSTSEISLNEIEGKRDSTDDFVFVRIGSSIPLSSSSFSFDFQSPPSQPLSISNRHGLLFISHPQQGFLVVKTNDVKAASKEIKEDNSKELSVEDVCVMDVKIGSVEILAVSDDEDESLLAAAVGHEIFFYKIASLLNKMQEPAFSYSLSNSVTVKDFKWQKKMTDTSFVILSTHGSLYHSTSEAKLNKIMDGVDAVDWSREGDYIAVARKHFISILSSDFKETLNMSLIFESWQTLTDPGGTIVVDSIKWLLDDSIILGCHQVDEDGAEDGYLIQVIKSQKKKISEISCNPTVYSFSDLFDGVWDILPNGSGPYLLANYLDHWGAVLMSNKKAIDQHISLLKWSSMDDNNKVVALELISDKYTPKIEVPVNGDDNLVFGFCIGTVSTYEKISIKVDENVHELFPHYALFCLTSEGKLILFHAACGATVCYFGSESTNKTHFDNQNEAHQQSNSSIYHPSTQLASGKDFTVNSQPSIFSEKRSHKNKENLGNSLSMTRDANSSHMLQGSDVAEHVDSLQGKLDKSTAQSLLEHIRASKSQDSTKQFSYVKDMTEELDILLSYIEKEGGFKDACTSYPENSVHSLEDDLWHLSERSCNCKKSIEEQLMDIQQLQNKMLQVSARQSCMKGIVELASNKTYWDIWNRQKLNPELEVKQQNILNANQNLTREIIELERHFNTVEINKFGDIGRSTLDHTQRSQVSSRQKPLLQSLYYTVNSHLSAAEQLSELLSRQMSNLNINSGSIKGYNQKSWINLINASEPETARRRTDSLERNWTTFKPPKTTVKRATPEKLSRVDKYVLFRKAKESFDAKKKDFATHQKRVQDSRSKQQLEVGSNVIPRWTNDTSGSPPIESNSNQAVGIQRTFTLSLSPSHSFSTSSGTQSSTKNTYGTPKTSSTETTLAQNPANPLFTNINSNTKNNSQMQNIFSQAQSSADFSSNISSINNRTITESRVQTSKNAENSFSSSVKDSNSSSLSTTTPFVSNCSKNITAVSQPNGPESTNMGFPFKLPISTSFSTSSLLSTTSTTAPLTSASMTSMSFGNSSFSGKLGDPTSSTLAATSASLSTHPISSSSSSSSTSALPLSTSSSSSFGQPLFSAFTSSSAAPVSTTAVSTDKPSSDSKPASPKSVTSEKVETSLPNSSSSSLPTNNTNMPSSVSQPQPVASSSITMPSSTEDKSKPSDADLSVQENGMEEEAPDTTGGFNFRSLSGIGLGSTMQLTPPKQNPFGGSFLTASSSDQSSMSSPFALQTSPGQGELFHPASFTIPSAQPTQPSSSSPQGAFSGFGQTSQIGEGQQALGSVLGSFGASRQIGAGIVQDSGSSSTNNAISSGFGLNAPSAAGGGFAAAAAKGGGFAAVASGGGGGFGAFRPGCGSGVGFGAAGSGGGFGAAGSGGVGSNASSGFGFAAANNAGGGFGATGAASGFKSDGFAAFDSNQGGGGGMFSSFGGNNASSGTGKPQLPFLHK